MSDTKPVDQRSDATAVRSAAAPRTDPATAMFSTSVVISGIRCLFAYVVFPWLLPALGVANDWGPWLGIIVGPVAIAFNILSIRRFQRSNHRWRWPITLLNSTIIVLLVVLTVMDVNAVL